MWATVLAADPVALTTVPWESLGTVGLCILTTVGIMTGRLVPRSTVDKMVSGLEARVVFQETELVKTRELKHELVRQNTDLLINARLSTALLEAVHPDQHSGGGHNANLAT